MSNKTENTRSKKCRCTKCGEYGYHDARICPQSNDTKTIQELYIIEANKLLTDNQQTQIREKVIETILRRKSNYETSIPKPSNYETSIPKPSNYETSIPKPYIPKKSIPKKLISSPMRDLLSSKPPGMKTFKSTRDVRKSDIQQILPSFKDFINQI